MTLQAAFGYLFALAVIQLLLPRIQPVKMQFQKIFLLLRIKKKSIFIELVIFFRFLITFLHNLRIQ